MSSCCNPAGQKPPFRHCSLVRKVSVWAADQRVTFSSYAFAHTYVQAHTYPTYSHVYLWLARVCHCVTVKTLSFYVTSRNRKCRTAFSSTRNFSPLLFSHIIWNQFLKKYSNFLFQIVIKFLSSKFLSWKLENNKEIKNCSAFNLSENLLL